MEYVDGRTVRDLLIEGHRLLPERSLEIISGVLRALEYSHQAGIVHRDIKPGNVMVTRSGDVKVMDFGIARAMNDAQATMTQTAQVIGTAQYLSPEQARGERVDARSDLYSTGCLMYELLTGRPPFTGDSPVAIAYQHVRENPIPPSRLDPDIPPWADAIVLKAMAKAPGDRYQSAAEMQADIQRAASGMQVAAMAAPPTRADYYGEYDYPQDRTQRMGQNTMMAGAATGQYPQRTGGFNAQTYGGDGGYPPERKSWARRWLPWLIPAAVIIAVIAVAASLLTSGGKTYFVPQVDGQTQAAAISQMQQAGFTNYHIFLQPNGTVPKGDVISTNPPNGQGVPSPTTQVTINVSAGVGKVSVPGVVNMSTNAATTALDNAHLNVNVQQDPTSTKPQGTVTRQDPIGGTQVAPGKTVTIYVSQGGVTVPSVVSLNYLKATQLLESDGLTVTSTPGSDPNNPPANPGDVYAQSIAANKVVPKGTAITLTYEMAPTQTPSPTPSPTDSTSPSPTTTDSPTTGTSSTPPASPSTGGGNPGGGNPGGIAIP
jgi:serine/threonine-protein kinase